MTEYTRFEQMLVTGARLLGNDVVAFVGFHWPMLIARIARRLHAPNMTVVYENGIVEDRLTSVFPTSPCDLTAAENAPVCVGSVEALYMWLGAGRVTMTLLEAAVVDRYGNVNTTAIGPYSRPVVRLPGSGGGTELASLGRNLLLISASTSRRSYPSQVDYVTSPGYLTGRKVRSDLGYKKDTGPKMLLNPFGIFKYDEGGEMYAAQLHNDVTQEEVAAAFDWPIRIEAGSGAIPVPTAAELMIVQAEIAHAKTRLYSMPQD